MLKSVFCGLRDNIAAPALVYSNCLLTAGEYAGVINRVEIRFGLDNITGAIVALNIEVSIEINALFFHVTFRKTGKSVIQIARHLLSHGVRPGEGINELKGQPISLTVAHLEETGYFIKEVSVGTKSMTKSEEETQ